MKENLVNSLCQFHKFLSYDVNTLPQLWRVRAALYAEKPTIFIAVVEGGCRVHPVVSNKKGG